VYALNGEHTMDNFTKLFNDGCEILGLDDYSLACMFDTSAPNIKRWKSGKVVPPAKMTVLRWMFLEVHAHQKAASKKLGYL
jgi:hypothetical protein